MPTPLQTAGPPHGGFRAEALYPQTLDCVHCGLCLSACPTYVETGRETSSPRGRVYLMRGVAEGRIPLGEVVVEEAYLCLGCRACETACPSGVRFGALLELTRAEIEGRGLRRGLAKRVEAFALTTLLPHPRRLRRLVSLLGIAQRLRLDRLALPFLPARLREVHAQLPPIPSRAERRALPERIPAEGERRGRVQLFVGCVMPELFGAANAATARVLARNGFEVVVPRDQGCCGALQAHAGLDACARKLARANAECFAREDADALVVNSAGCSAAMRQASEWLGAEGAAYADTVRDVAEFLDAVGVRPPGGRIEARVCYDDPCHLVHGQGVRDAPRRLLAQIPGVELVPHADPEACCGAAGIYNLTHPEMARAVLERKLAALRAADPDVIATGNPGCLLQIARGAARAGLRARIVHPIELLDEAYRAGG
ncbi:MAG: (Fe-S)-binding protein [Deltaproteobacteria bacterium]|nr:MAG: (Fe-S)-binding protein [Deltaproteobacteria bacterium]